MIYPSDYINKIICGDCLTVLKTIPDNLIDCCVTSPPYFNLRDYQVDNQIGLEKTPSEYVQKLVDVFHEVMRVLKPTGTLWLNLGDSYAGSSGMGSHVDNKAKKGMSIIKDYNRSGVVEGIQPKNILGIPWRVAFALQEDGWILRQDIIWCLSGGTYVYVKTKNGVSPMMIRDLSRLKPNTVQLWDGEKWNNILGISKSLRKGNEIEFELRSGERISCTPNHKFPTTNGLKEARDIIVGDILETTKLPDVEQPRDCNLDEDAAWFAGLYIAEGSKSDDCIQIAGHSKETDRWNRLLKIAHKYGGYITRSVDGNNMNIRLYGKILNAIIDEFVSGHNAYNKGFASVVWNYSNNFISSMIDGYLSGDGHWDKKNNRWRLGFTRNYNLERDMRTACARLGYKLVIKLAHVKYKGKAFPIFRGELRKTASDHFNNKFSSEIIGIRKARCRYVYDIGLESNPHLFALASGILTHNSKLNPMPESVKDRCTKSHEYIFLLSKTGKYYYDYKAILEPAAYDGRADTHFKGSEKYKDSGQTFAEQGHERWPNKITGRTGDGHSGYFDNDGSPRTTIDDNGIMTRNKHSVWTVSTKPYSGAHFATFPPDLIIPMIQAGCPEKGLVFDPFMGSGTVAETARRLNRNYLGIELNSEYIKLIEERLKQEVMGI